MLGPRSLFLIEVRDSNGVGFPHPGVRLPFPAWQSLGGPVMPLGATLSKCIVTWQWNP